MSRTIASIVCGSTLVLRSRSAMTSRPTTSSSQPRQRLERRAVGVVADPRRALERAASAARRRRRAPRGARDPRARRARRRPDGPRPPSDSSRKRGPLTVPSSATCAALYWSTTSGQHRIEPAGLVDDRDACVRACRPRRRRTSGSTAEMQADRRQQRHADQERLAADGVLELRHRHGPHLAPGEIIGPPPRSPRHRRPVGRCARRCRAATAASPRSGRPGCARRAGPGAPADRRRWPGAPPAGCRSR